MIDHEEEASGSHQHRDGSSFQEDGLSTKEMDRRSNQKDYLGVQQQRVVVDFGCAADAWTKKTKPPSAA